MGNVIYVFIDKLDWKDITSMFSNNSVLRSFQTATSYGESVL